MAASTLPLSLTERRPAQAAHSGRRQLTRQQARVTILVACGLNDGDIAARLCIAEATASKHVKDACGRLGVHSRAALVAKSIVLGEIPLEEMVLVMWSLGKLPVGQGEPAENDCD